VSKEIFPEENLLQDVQKKKKKRKREAKSLRKLFDAYMTPCKEEWEESKVGRKK